MKQEQSILKWASLMLEQSVKSLSSIQDVRFVKNLLWKIDPGYFSHWQSGSGTQSFAQVVGQIGQYFKQEIGTDIKQFIESLNVYRNPRELWQLLLGIAIKGTNRGQNITLILDMDHSVQAELVGIVSEIISKFGQEAASSNVQEESDSEQQPLNERQLLMELMKDHEDLSLRMADTEAELEKQKLEILSLLKQKQELQQQIFMSKLQKASFLQTLANGNRSDSRIFDDGEQTVLQTGNLTELANDIIIFVRDLRRKVNEEMQRNNQLQDLLRQTKEQAEQVAQDNQTYLKQLGYLNVYEDQINQLRQEINEVFNQNAVLIDRINDMEEDNAKLRLNLYRRNEENLPELEKQVSVQQPLPGHRRRVRFDSQQEEDSNRSSEVKEGLEPNRSEGNQSDPDKNKVRDQLRQPKLRIRLQKEIQYLKTSNQSLKRQNSSLKQANQNLQQTAKEFLASNQAIAKNWEEDFRQLMAQVNYMGQIRAQITQQAHQQEREEQQIQQREQQQPTKATAELHYNRSQYEQAQGEGLEQEPQEQKQERQRQREQQKQKTRQLQSKLQSITAQMAQQKAKQNQHQNEIELWRDIATKLKRIVTRFKQNETNYQNTICTLKLQNSQLLKSIGQNLQQLAQSRKVRAKVSIEQQMQKQQPVGRSQLRMSKQSEYRSSDEKIPRMSFLSIRQGQEFEQDTINKRVSENSRFYKAGSIIVHDINENQHISQLQESQFQEKYVTLNRRLFSESKASLHNIRSQFLNIDISKNSELQARFQEEIKKMEEQYCWLNNSYQQLFRKLNIYTDQLRVKQYAKLQGLKLLEELQHGQQQLLDSKDSEIVKLNVINRCLRGVLLQQAAKKQELIQVILQIQKFCQQFVKNKDNSYELGIKQMVLALEEIKINFTLSMRQPIEFLQLSIQGDSAGKAQQFYKLYSKEKDKNRQLHSQLELLASTLLQYRNILQF